MNQTPMTYWRRSKQWPELIGQVGTVIAATTVRVAPPELAEMAPYAFLLIELADGQRLECVGLVPDTYQPGQQVQLQLRRFPSANHQSVIWYDLKAIPI